MRRVHPCVIEVDAWSWYGADEAFPLGPRDVFDALRLSFWLPLDQFEAFQSGKRRLLPVPQPGYMTLSAVPSNFAMELYTVEEGERRSTVFAVKAHYTALGRYADRDADFWTAMFGMSMDEFRVRWDTAYPDDPWEDNPAVLLLEVLCADAAGTPLRLPDALAEEKQSCL